MYTQSDASLIKDILKPKSLLTSKGNLLWRNKVVVSITISNQFKCTEAGQKPASHLSIHLLPI